LMMLWDDRPDEFAFGFVVTVFQRSSQF